ncbi:MAG: hypothetical protein JW925_04485 [Syntrophaceae bacterium]|nr:hypothetical protein [Syntrophaceae bacterium]
MKKIMTAVLIVTMLILVPIISQAEEPAVTGAFLAGEKSNPVEQKQEEDKVTGEIAASVLSAYIWRGQEMTRHSIVIQPSVTAGYKGFTANVWGNLDTNPYSAVDDEYSSNFTETDITFSYMRKWGIVQVGGGYIYYGLAGSAPGGEDLLDSQELFFSLGLDTILAPTLTVYKEIDHYHQWYATLGVSHTFALQERFGLKIAAQASYLKSEDETTYPEFDSNSLATKNKFNNFHDAVASIALPISVTDKITITPLLNFVFPLSDDAKYEMKARGLQGTRKTFGRRVVDDPADRQSTYLYGGVALSFAF